MSATSRPPGTPISVLIPWNGCGAYVAATLGLATFHYLPYAVFNFASPLLAIAIAYLGVRMLRGPAVPESVSPPPVASGEVRHE